MLRQGDVLITRVKHTVAADAKRRERVQGRLVLAYGEVTGHAHAIDEALAELFEKKDGKLYLTVGETGAHLRHEEHAALTLEPGTYEVINQREYTPTAIRRVSD